MLIGKIIRNMRTKLRFLENDLNKLEKTLEEEKDGKEKRDSGVNRG